MANNDTIELLRACSSSIESGVSCMSELISHAKSSALKKALQNSVTEHKLLGYETSRILSICNEGGKEPSLLEKGITWLKTETTMALDSSDQSVASIVTDGCNMGIKTLNKSVNENPFAESESKALAGKIITDERNLIEYVKSYL